MSVCVREFGVYVNHWNNVLEEPVGAIQFMTPLSRTQRWPPPFPGTICCPLCYYYYYYFAGRLGHNNRVGQSNSLDGLQICGRRGRPNFPLLLRLYAVQARLLYLCHTPNRFIYSLAPNHCDKWPWTASRGTFKMCQFLLGDIYPLVSLPAL